jgi:hypothetical protein
MTQKEFEALAAAAKVPSPEQIEDYNETLRVWRATCQVCGETIVGPLSKLRQHRHGN